jgi:hypothetical protein
MKKWMKKENHEENLRTDGFLEALETVQRIAAHNAKVQFLKMFIEEDEP